MRLIQVLTVVLTQLSVGSLLMAGVLSPREIRVSFFQLNSLLCAVAAAVALVLSKFVLEAAWAEVRFLGFAVIGATAAYGAFRLARLDAGRVLLLVSGFVGLVFGLLPLGEKMLAARGWHTRAAWMFDAGMVSAALLLGVTNVGMILGHWYLIMRRLSFVYLQRFAQLLCAAVALRCVVVILIFGALKRYDAEFAGVFLPPLLSVDGQLLFFVLRALIGLAAPAVLAVLVLRCVSQKANQAATGLLYIAEVCVLFGELFAAYLLI